MAHKSKDKGETYEIFDFHTHNCKELPDELERAGVKKTVVMLYLTERREKGLGYFTPDGKAFPTTKDEILKGNEDLYFATKKNPRFVPFAWINPLMEEARELLREYKEKGFKGLKLHPCIDDFHPFNREPLELISEAEKLNLPVMIHTGWKPPAAFTAYAKVKHIGELADIFPNVTFIAAHMVEQPGINDPYEHALVAKKHDNVYLECSFIPHIRRTKEVVGMLGSERILLGTDFPAASHNILEDARKVTQAEIPRKDKEAILYDNAARLLGL